MPLFKANLGWQTTSGLPRQSTTPPDLKVRVARKTREQCGPGRGHDGTVDIPTAESEPPEDGNIQSAKPLPTPEPETFTRAASMPPSPPTQNSESVTTSETPAPMQSAPYGIMNPHPPQEIAAGGSRDSPPPNATNAVAQRKGTAHKLNPKPHNKPEPLNHNAPQRGRGRRGPHRS